MVKFILTHTIFLILMVLQSCDRPELISENNLGKYELVSLESNIPLDLNYDNVKSTDFKSELTYLYYENHHRKPKYDLWLFDGIGEKEKWAFLLTTPKDNYNPDSDIRILELRFGSGDYNKYLIVKNNQVDKIVHHYSDIFNFDEVWLIENRYPVPYEVTFNTVREVTIKLRQKFFDLETESWVLVDLIGVFEKLE